MTAAVSSAARRFRWALRSLLLCAGLGSAAAAPALESGPLIQGSYEIETWFVFTYGPPAGAGCMMIGNSPGLIPSVYHWPAGGDHCGSSAPEVQAVWDIYPIVSGNKVRHVIKSRANGLCLGRTNNGQAVSPNLFLWADNTDKQYCGLPSAEVFIANGQAAWDFTGLETKVHGAGGVVYAGQPRLGGAPLGFSAVYNPAPAPDLSKAEFLTIPSIAEAWRMNFWSVLTKPLGRTFQ